MSLPPTRTCDCVSNSGLLTSLSLIKFQKRFSLPPLQKNHTWSRSSWVVLKPFRFLFYLNFLKSVSSQIIRHTNSDWTFENFFCFCAHNIAETGFIKVSNDQLLTVDSGACAILISQVLGITMPGRTKFSLSLKSVLQLKYWIKSILKCAQLYHQLERFAGIRENVNDEDLICESRQNSSNSGFRTTRQLWKKIKSRISQ